MRKASFTIHFDLLVTGCQSGQCGASACCYDCTEVYSRIIQWLFAFDIVQCWQRISLSC